MPDSSERFPTNLERILAVRLDNIGDVVMLSPALRALRMVFPKAHLTLMASPGGSQVAPLLPWIDEVMACRAVWQDISKNLQVDAEKEYQLVSMLADQHFDAAFIFTSFSQSPYPPAYACYLARIPLQIGQSKEFGGRLLTHWIKSLPDDAHQVERSLHMLRSAGLTDQGSHLELKVPLEFQQSADQILKRSGVGTDSPYIVLAPGASAAARRYPEARYAEAVKQVTAKSGLPVVVIGSPREADAFPAIERLVQESPAVVSLIGQTSVPEMAAVLQRAQVVLANNSGSMHFAAAFQRPMVILFSGTELLQQWAPNTPGARFLFQPTHCTPCHDFQCRYHLECLDVPAEQVAQNVLELLSHEASTVSRFVSNFKPGGFSSQ